MNLSPDPDFEEFALDCIRLSNQEKSPILRRKLLTLAREWMHAPAGTKSLMERPRYRPRDQGLPRPWG
jgi:hypothetical protein